MNQPLGRVELVDDDIDRRPDFGNFRPFILLDLQQSGSPRTEIDDDVFRLNGLNPSLQLLSGL